MQYIMLNKVYERRFRGRKGWAPLTDYIAVQKDSSYVVRKDGSRHKCDAYSSVYCVAQKENGAWEELSPVLAIPCPLS